jgi:hypothetical protein
MLKTPSRSSSTFRKAKLAMAYVDSARQRARLTLTEFGADKKDPTCRLLTCNTVDRNPYEK